MTKIIINYEGNDPSLALDLVKSVIEKGRISEEGKSYCYATIFPMLSKTVYSQRNKASDTFIVKTSKGK